MLKHPKRVLSIVGLAAVSAMVLSACMPGTKTLALAGSDTTFDVMGEISNDFNAGPSEDTASNIPPTGTISVPGDKDCPTQNQGPINGSSAGISALAADTTGCIDIARSSRDKRPTDAASLEFFAFAKDAVSWARFPNACPGGDAAPAGCAPITLTQAQLQGIYNCTEAGGFPLYTNWNQVGGDNEPIIRYLPQVGSGTLSFFETRILGLTTAQQGVLDDSSCAATSKPIRVQENAGNAVVSGNRAAAIVPYSFAQWTAQSNGTVIDLRAGAQLGRINNVVPNATTVNNGTFLGRRYVYNVVKNTGPSYQDAVDFVGVDAGGNGYLCNNDPATNATITQYGFILNPVGPAGGGVTTSSRCRKNPAPL